MTGLYKETTTQFLARMIVATREQTQISSADARRLSDHAQHGSHTVTTMPEERRSGSKLLKPATVADLVTD
jgi:hypothetical protein